MDMDPSNNSNNGGNDQSHIRELANQRLRQTPIKAKQQKERVAKLLRTPSLGLKHNVNNQPLLGKLNKRLYLQRTPNRGQFRTDQQINNHKTTDSDDKPSHVDASFIRIGTWKRVAQNSKDLVAKIYFGKRRLVWEILERGLKSKIEIQWESIVGMRLFLEENGSIIFEVELSRPPLFCKEIYPLPMRHTLWDLAPDFTDGQAKTCKIHSLQFPSGAFERHFSKLLECEPRFLQMCKSPFPTQQSLYFPSNVHNMASTSGSTASSFGYNKSKLNINSAKLQQQQQKQQHYLAYSRNIPTNTMGHLSLRVKEEAMNVTAAPGNYCSYKYNDTQQSLYFSSNFHNMANTSNSPFGYNHTYPNISSVQQQQQQQQYYSELSHLPDQSGQFLINQQYNQVYPEVSHLPDQSGQCSIIQQYNQVYQTTVEPSMLYKDSTHVVTEATSQIEYHNPVSSRANDNGSGGASHPLPQLILVGGCNENQFSTNYSGFEDATISNNYEQEKASDSTLIQQQQHHQQQYYPYSRTIPTMPLVQQYNQVCQANGEPASIFCEESTHVVKESTSSSSHEQVETNDSDSMGWVWVNPGENMAAGDKVEHSSFDPLKKL